MNKLVITNYEDHILEALYSDGKLSDLMLFDRQSILSNIYVGKVENIVSNIDAAFVDIGTGLPCYYSITDNKHIFLNAKKDSVLKAGDEILIQVSKDAIKTKNPVATSEIELKTENLLVNTSGRIGISGKIRFLMLLTVRNGRNCLLIGRKRQEIICTNWRREYCRMDLAVSYELSVRSCRIKLYCRI